MCDEHVDVTCHQSTDGIMWQLTAAPQTRHVTAKKIFNKTALGVDGEDSGSRGWLATC